VKGWEYSARCRPAKGVSGDYYDFILLDGGKLGLLLADVCGKGMGAALLGASLHGALRAFAPLAPSHPGEVLNRVNRLLYQTTSSERYATVFYGVIEPEARTLTYANAGHCPPWLICEKKDQRLASLTPPVGMFAEIASEEAGVTLEFGVGSAGASEEGPKLCVSGAATDSEITMPFKSKAQQRYLMSEASPLTPAQKTEWAGSTDFSKLPEKAGKLKPLSRMKPRKRK
jgi:Stage II sporulation protein E (SpoIIE)